MNRIVKDIGTLLITLLVISFVTFFAFQIIPGDRAVTALGVEGDKAAIEALREEYGLNKNIAERYVQWIKGVFTGDLGQSLQYKVPVTQLLSQRILLTMELGIISCIIIVIISIPIGIIASVKAGGIIDRIILITSQIGMSIPPFFLGMIVTWIFGIILLWFKPGEYESVGYLIFPALSIAIPKIGMVVKFLRNSMVKQLKMDYVKTAKSKGNSKAQILCVHVLKNAMVPVTTFIGIIIAEVFAGSVLIEQVFNLPGVGRLLVTSIANRDFPVVQGIILYMAVIVMVINFIVDCIYKYLDPRVRAA